MLCTEVEIASHEICLKFPQDGPQFPPRFRERDDQEGQVNDNKLDRWGHGNQLTIIAVSFQSLFIIDGRIGKILWLCHVVNIGYDLNTDVGHDGHDSVGEKHHPQNCTILLRAYRKLNPCQ